MRIGSSGTVRINKVVRPITGGNNFRKANFVRDGVDRSLALEDDPLREYYQKEGNLNNNSKSKGKDKKKDISRERSH